MKAKYYGNLFDLWFPANSMPAGMDRDKTQDTFMKGGYYRYDVPGTNKTVLSLNSMLMYR